MMKKLIWIPFFVWLAVSVSCNRGMNPITGNPVPLSVPPPAPPGSCQVLTFAGQAGVTGITNGPRTGALFTYPCGVAVDAAGNLYVADTFDYLVRKITPGGVVSFLAGPTSLYAPIGIAVDTAGNVYVSDWVSNVVMKIPPGGTPSILAGTYFVAGSANGTGTNASFAQPDGLAVDASGNVYVADYNNDLIRVITPGGVVSTLAGSAGVAGSANGTGTAASFNQPEGVAVDAAGNVYVADQGNELIRKIAPGGVVSNLAGQAGVTGMTNGTGTAALFNIPSAITLDSSGNLYVADNGNHQIRMISPGAVVSTLAGSGVSGAANGPCSIASFRTVGGLAVDVSGNVYAADNGNSVIREIIP